MPVQLYKTADGWLYICCMNQKFWEILVRLIGRPELGADPRFADLASRRENRDVLTDVLDAVFMTRTRAEWMQILQGQIPAAPVESLDGAIDNPFVAEVGMVQEPIPGSQAWGRAHPAGRTLRMFANPLRFDGARLPQRAAPGLDADGPALRGRFSADAA